MLNGISAAVRFVRDRVATSVAKRASELPPLPPRQRPSAHGMPAPASKAMEERACHAGMATARVHGPFQQNPETVAGRLATPPGFAGSATQAEIASFVDEVLVMANLAEVSDQANELEAGIVPMLDKAFFEKPGMHLVERLTDGQCKDVRAAFVTLRYEKGVKAIDARAETASIAKADLRRLQERTARNQALKAERKAREPVDTPAGATSGAAGIKAAESDAAKKAARDAAAIKNAFDQFYR